MSEPSSAAQRANFSGLRRPDRSLSTGLEAQEERACETDRTAETSASTPVSPDLPGPEVVEAPIWARKHRRSHNEGSPKPNAFVCTQYGNGRSHEFDWAP